MDMSAITAMLDAAKNTKVEPKQEETSSYNRPGAGAGFKKNEELPNIYDDHKIEPLEIDKTKLKKSYAYAVVAIDENPSSEIMDVMIKVAEILKSKRFIYRFNGSKTPTLSRILLDKQDLTMPDSYQVFVPWILKDDTSLDEVTITSKRPTFLAARLAKQLTKYMRKDPDNPDVKHAEFGFSKVPGSVRNLLANNIHLFLGKDCLTKLSFIVIYSADGVEKVSEIVRETTNMRAADLVKIAEELSIPLFNIGKADGTKRLLEFINKD